MHAAWRYIPAGSAKMMGTECQHLTRVDRSLSAAPRTGNEVEVPRSHNKVGVPIQERSRIGT